jgi:hypothetical protein
MKHLEKYEDFAYHSELEENFEDDEFLNKERKKKKPTSDELEQEKCFRCQKPGRKPYYPDTMRIIPGFA